MSDTKTKYEFLKRVRPMTKEQQEKLFEMAKSNPYSIYNDVVFYGAHHTTDAKSVSQAREDINKLLFRAYVNWRNMMKNNKYQRGNAQIFADFLNDSFFDPDNDNFNNSGLTIEQLIVEAQKKYPVIEKIFGIYAPVYLQNYSKDKGSSFVHIRSDLFYHPKKPKQDTECRLYLNLKAENIAKVARLALRLGQRKGLSLYFKFSEKRLDQRNDTLLFYCSYEEASEVVDLIEEIKSAEPKLFEGTEKDLSHLGVINGYIGFGEEPSKEMQKKFKDEGGISYTEARGEMLSGWEYVRRKLERGAIDGKQALEEKAKITKNFDVARPRYIFLNQSTVDELEKAGYNLSDIGKDAVVPSQMGE